MGEIQNINEYRKEKMYAMLSEEDKKALEIGYKLQKRKRRGIFWKIINYFKKHRF